MARAALVVIDLQNGFCHPRGSLAQSSQPLVGVEDAVAHAAEAVSAARAVSMPVVFTRHVYRPGYADMGRNMGARGADIAALGGMIVGSWDGAVAAELGWSSQDLTVDKARFDAFLWTSLDPLLASLAVDHLYIAGVLTNICVESSVRSAYMRDFTVTVLADGCAARSARLHEMSLWSMREGNFADVTDVASFARLRAGRFAEGRQS